MIGNKTEWESGKESTNCVEFIGLFKNYDLCTETHPPKLRKRKRVDALPEECVK